MMATLRSSITTETVASATDYDSIIDLVANDEDDFGFPTSPSGMAVVDEVQGDDDSSNTMPCLSPRASPTRGPRAREEGSTSTSTSGPAVGARVRWGTEYPEPKREVPKLVAQLYDVDGTWIHKKELSDVRRWLDIAAVIPGEVPTQHPYARHSLPSMMDWECKSIRLGKTLNRLLGSNWGSAQQVLLTIFEWVTAPVPRGEGQQGLKDWRHHFWAKVETANAGEGIRTQMLLGMRPLPYGFKREKLLKLRTRDCPRDPDLPAIEYPLFNDPIPVPQSSRSKDAKGGVGGRGPQEVASMTPGLSSASREPSPRPSSSERSAGEAVNLQGFTPLRPPPQATPRSAPDQKEKMDAKRQRTSTAQHRDGR